MARRAMVAGDIPKAAVRRIEIVMDDCTPMFEYSR